jgi:hypothetical protein
MKNGQLQFVRITANGKPLSGSWQQLYAGQALLL